MDDLELTNEEWIVTLLRSIDHSLKILVAQHSPVNITITNPPSSTDPYHPWVNT